MHWLTHTVQVMGHLEAWITYYYVILLYKLAYFKSMMRNDTNPWTY